MNWDLVWPVAAAMTAGGLIGIERTYHGHPAGFRTHILVCLTSCLLMLAAMHQATWAFTALPGQTVVIDPTRMSHGLLTGIGFLCAGVIFREGFSVHGLTTAASLWVTSAIGVLYGVGMTELALIGSGATLAVLAVLRFLDAKLPHVGVMDVVLRWKRGQAPSGLAVRDLLRGNGVKVVRLGHVMTHDGAIHEHHLKVKGHVPIDIDRLVAQLSAEDGLAGFSILPREE
ncbi:MULTISPECIES: MgtC/SapB family protein [unclassified Brevundimonas]|uniref:MgtC/SapB family protein n=1 Tax=unclassified Brevundimonas TaxID=2622653 RepID=UPI0006F9B572|nr:MULTISPECIES: MgtC/SapB family protein [unclassified Brevundimonas]KQY85732.1 Mg2+ transporter-C family protein [Brevundimonas sp. Root1423]KRA26501.1 Mg2+ transporter-C family protein [Brevundimonas sp. Root608]